MPWWAYVAVPGTATLWILVEKWMRRKAKEKP
jgi:hypothetical protein